MTKPLPVLRPLVLVALFPLTVLACLRAFGPSSHRSDERPAVEARPPAERAVDRTASRAECGERAPGAAAQPATGGPLEGQRAPSRAGPDCEPAGPSRPR
jgi:hypothetical protein